MAVLEGHSRVAAGYAVGDQRTEVLLLCTLVEERIADKPDECLELSSRKMDRCLEERVNAGEHRFDRPQSVAKVLVYARLLRSVAARRSEHIQMMIDRILDAGHRPIVEKRRLQRGVAQRRASELVAIVRIPGDLLQAKVLVLARSIERHVARAEAEFRRN